MAIPVYTFTGFLESGKTLFIQDTLEDNRFNSGDRILLLVCEEGEEEYDASKFSGHNVKVVIFEDIEELNEESLTNIAKEFKPAKILIEYNGMWQIQNLYDSLPEEWVPYQNMLFFDASTFASYNANMRSLVVDKLSDADVIVFNRIEKGFDTMELHKVVRGSTRRANILYEYKDGTLIPDEIEDPLPFDVESDEFEVADKDFALFYRDLTEDMKKYKGKTVTFKALAAKDDSFPKNTCAIGRHIMTCCADDIQYCGLVAKTDNISQINNSCWYLVTASIEIKFSGLYRRKGPIFIIKNFEPAIEPEDPVATFY